MKLKKKIFNDKIAIVIPVFNEEKNIFNELNGWINKFQSLKFKKYKFFIINDGSSDDSLKQIQRIKSKKIQIFSYKNSGHGNSCLKGYKLALKQNFEWILQIDSDGQCDPKYIKTFLEYSKKNYCVFGLRVSRDDGILRLAFSKILSFLIFLKKGKLVKDMNVPYRLIHKTVLTKCINSLSSKLILKNAHLTYLISEKFNIYYIPINFLKRSFGSSKYNLLTMLFQVLNLIIYI